MNPYIPNNSADRDEMLKLSGINNIDDLFCDISNKIKLNRSLNLEAPMSELEVTSKLKELSYKNKSAKDLVCFLGAGAYDHYIPSIVKHLTCRSEFYSAYTPYQPEISQGTLQAIFEFQSMITTLTGMEISNASMYDGATSLAEAAMIATSHSKRNKVLVSKTVHPEYREVLKTYLPFQNVEVCEIEMINGVTNVENLKNLTDSNTACVIIQNPNFFGIIEDMEEVETISHANKSLLVMSVNPISLGLLKPPSEYGADIVTGEGKTLGNPLNFGGPYLGFIAVNKALVRKMPGRICGLTNDVDGKRAFVLTLQAREQHIRREKATSNICSNQALNALTATIYLSTLGKSGLREIAEQCVKKSHYLSNQITASGKYRLLFDKPFFNEFALDLGNIETTKMNNHLINNGILGGYDISKKYPQYKNSTLLCVTEKRTQKEMENLVKSMEGIA